MATYMFIQIIQIELLAYQFILEKNPTYVLILCKIYNKTISKTSNGSDIASNSTYVLNRGNM